MLNIKNEWGYSLEEIMMISESEAHNDESLNITSSLIFLKGSEGYLMGLHNKRKQWEFPGGSLEEGESPRQCIIRELYEETDQRIEDAGFVALARLKNPSNKTEHLALFYSECDELDDFEPNDEIVEIRLIDINSDIGKHDEIGMYILKHLIV